MILSHQSGMHPKPRENRAPYVWKLDLDGEAWQRLVAHLHASVDREITYPRRPEATDWVVFAVERWSIFHNCHDWTAGCLAAVGLDLDHPTIRTSSSFAEELQSIETQLAIGGITVIGPTGIAAQSSR